MACFVAPMTEAIVTTIVTKACEKNGSEKAVKVSEDLHTLNKMLWGGSALLAFEHVWHGEVVPFYPFLTAASSAESAAVMLHEIATSGVAMAVLVTVAWGAITIVKKQLAKKHSPALEVSK